MTKYISILFILFFVIFMAACAEEPAPAATPITVPTVDVSYIEPAVEPVQIVETAVPATVISTPSPLTDSNIMTVDSDGNTAVDSTALDNTISQIAVTALTNDEVANLLYMREEEKLAHDVYMALYAQWGLPIFQNIANSELTHTEAVKMLLNRYDLDDPALGNAAGVFTDAFLQDLYDQLVAQGSQSLSAALQVGATIEDLDIVDLQTAVAQTDNPDIILVYENLMKGSRNHLRSFVTMLQRKSGEAYQPQYLAPAAYEAIINSPKERGNW